MLRPNEIRLYYTDNKGRWVKNFHPLADLMPAPPSSAKTDVMILDGPEKGRVLQVFKIVKKPVEKAIFKEAGKQWEELLTNVCDCQRVF